jgi:hypothetical protein
MDSPHPLTAETIPETWAEIPIELRGVIIKVAIIAQTLTRMGKFGTWVIGGLLMMCGLTYYIIAGFNQWMDLHRKWNG